MVSSHRQRLTALTAIAALGLILLPGCGSSSSKAASTSSKAGSPSGSLTIALQQDIAFAPLDIVDQENWLAQALPNVTVHWDVLSSGSAIQSGMLSGSVDAGAVGIAPFIIGQTKGVGWKLLTSLGESLQSLVVKPNITSFKDISSSDRIAVVSPTSVEAVALQKMAQSKLGNAKALNANFVQMTQPVAAEAFQAGSIQGVVAVAPYANKEVAAGGHVLDTSYDEFGRSTLDSVVINNSYYTSHPAIAQALNAQIVRAETLLTTDPTQAASVVAAYDKGEESASALKAAITDPNQTWTNVPHGYLAYAAFIKSEGLTTTAATTMASLEEPTLAQTPGN